MKYIIRLIVLPFWSMTSLIFLLRIWVNRCIRFVKYGGEQYTYPNKDEVKRLADIYSLLKDQYYKGNLGDKK